MTRLIMPTIHSNGTSKVELVEQHLAVVEASSALLKALEAGTPHGRDYPQGNHGPAHDAWWERIVAVERIRDEMERQAMKITLEGLE